MNGQRNRRPRREEDQATSTAGLRPMHISLRSGERLFLNGAVLRVDRKVTLELLNDATFLLENHVLQVEDTTTPLRQLYFAAQAMLMDPQNANASRALFDAMAADLRRCLKTPSLLAGLDEACTLMAAERTFQALKTIRSLFDEEAALLRREQPAGLAKGPSGSAPRGDGHVLQAVVPPQSYTTSDAAGASGQRHMTTLQ